MIRILEDRLLYRVVDPPSEQILDGETSGVIRPTQLHEVGILGPMRSFAEFYAEPTRAPELRATTSSIRAQANAEKG